MRARSTAVRQLLVDLRLRRQDGEGSRRLRSMNDGLLNAFLHVVGRFMTSWPVVLGWAAEKKSCRKNGVCFAGLGFLYVVAVYFVFVGSISVPRAK